MAAPFLSTYRDAIDHLVDYTNGTPESAEDRRLRSAVQAAYEDLTLQAQWTYNYRHHRLHFVAPYSTGTVAYDHTGGTNERQLTLTSGTWPTWAAYGRVKVDDVVCAVASRISDTVLTLDTALNPGADVAAGTSYTLMRSVYTLPPDFKSMDNIHSEDGYWSSTYITPNEWLGLERHAWTSGDSFRWTVLGDPDLYASRAVAVWGYPSAASTLDFIYQRMARPLKFDGYTSDHRVGTITGTAGLTAITGASTQFAADYVGSVIRFSRNTTDEPSGLAGRNPYREQRIISAVGSTTGLTVDSALTYSYAATTKYCISDPLDMDVALYQAFLRGCELQYEIMAQGKIERAQALYDRAILRAREADVPTFQSKFCERGSDSAPNPYAWWRTR